MKPITPSEIDQFYGLYSRYLPSAQAKDDLRRIFDQAAVVKEDPANAKDAAARNAFLDGATRYAQERQDD